MEIYNLPQNPIESYQFLALCAPIPLLASFLLFLVLALLEVFGILELLGLLEVLHILCIFFSEVSRDQSNRNYDQTLPEIWLLLRIL